METLKTTIREIIVTALALRIDPATIDENAPLFGPEKAGGLGLDSLSSLEILAALSDRFQSPLDDIEAGDFYSVASLAEYLHRTLERQKDHINQ